MTASAEDEAALMTRIMKGSIPFVSGLLEIAQNTPDEAELAAKLALISALMDEVIETHANTAKKRELMARMRSVFRAEVRKILSKRSPK